jgi:hypothetical protein
VAEEGFLVRREQDVEVVFVRRWGKWQGRQVGTVVTLDQVDLAEVAEGQKWLQRQMPYPVDIRARCAYPSMM